MVIQFIQLREMDIFLISEQSNQKKPCICVIFVNNNYFMLQKPASRNKTTIMHRFQGRRRKLKSMSSTPHKMSIQIYNEEEFELSNFQIKSKDLLKANFSNRDSGKINISPSKIKNKHGSHFQLLQIEVRTQLQNLSLKEKLLQIQNLLKSARQLSKAYGYFTVTLAMLKFTFASQIKISLWIHPYRRSTKPLHPIKKQTQFQCQLLCVSQLKGVIKTLFPTIELSDNKTFVTLIAYVDSLRAQNQQKKEKEKQKQKQKQRGKKIMRKDSNKTAQGSGKCGIICDSGCRKDQASFLLGSSKTIPTVKYLKSQQQIQQELQQVGADSSLYTNFYSKNALKKMGDGSKYLSNLNSHTNSNKNLGKIKQTSSTLVQTIRSVNSLRQKLKKQLAEVHNTIQIKKQRQLKKSQSMDPTQKLSPQPEMQVHLSHLTPKNKPALALTCPSSPPPNTPQSPSMQTLSPSIPSQSFPCSPSTPISPPTNPQHLAKNPMKISTTTRRIMTMSIQIQGEINNLFGDEGMGSGFYSNSNQGHGYGNTYRNSDVKNLKNSILSRVAEEFQDLF